MYTPISIDEKVSREHITPSKITKRPTISAICDANFAVAVHLVAGRRRQWSDNIVGECWHARMRELFLFPSLLSFLALGLYT